MVNSTEKSEWQEEQANMDLQYMQEVHAAILRVKKKQTVFWLLKWDSCSRPNLGHVAYKKNSCPAMFPEVCFKYTSAIYQAAQDKSLWSVAAFLFPV